MAWESDILQRYDVETSKVVVNAGSALMNSKGNMKVADAGDQYLTYWMIHHVLGLIGC